MTQTTLAPDDKAWQQYICRACGLIYDEAEGDPDSGIAPGTRFADIPDDWQCPLCGVGKSDFELYTPRKATLVAPAPKGLPESHYHTIIIGAGIAGWAAAEEMRATNPAQSLLMISADSACRYHKPELSVAISRQITPNQLIREDSEEAAQALGIRLMAHTFVIAIDSHQQQIRTTRGSFHYSKLILALGATPHLPPSLPPQYTWRINHLNGFIGLQNALSKPAQHIAIIGAGMIGSELAEDLARAGHHILLIDRSAQPLAGILPESAAKRLSQAFSQQGIRYLGEHTLSHTDRQADGSYRLTLTDVDGHTQQETVQQIIAATGLRLNERLPKSAGLDYHPINGINVNPNTLETSQPNIYALGDAIAINGKPCRFIAPIRQQAQTIAAQISGNSNTYQHQDPLIRLKTKSLAITISGKPEVHQAWHTTINTPQELTLQQQQQQKINAEIHIRQH